MPASQLLRQGLLEGRVIALAGGGGELGGAVTEACSDLAATVVAFDGHDEDELAERAASLVSEHERIDAVICDADFLFTSALRRGQQPLEALRLAVDRSWDATRAVANGAFIPGERGGKVMLLAPRVGAGELAGAARAALENTARTVSIEWARYGITAVAIGTDSATAPAELAALTAFIASPAGDYYSGCVFELGVAA